MLSRLAVRSVKNNNAFLSIIRPSTTATKTDDAQAMVPWSRPKQLIHPGKVRMGFIPEEWFQMFYPKTGVTGPYVFGTFFTAFLVSKEYYVLEHEFFTGCSIAIFVIYCIKQFGPKLAEYLDKEIEKDDEQLNSLRELNIVGLKDSIEQEKQAQFSAKGQTMLFEAKRENIGLQLEAVYRERLQKVHSEVKRKLDYQLETANVKVKLEQRHMVNWIVENVRKSITPTQETASLKQCLSDLKAIAARA